MEFNLSLPYDNEIEENDKTAIESYIEKTIKQHENNASNLTTFAMEASFALTAGESRASGLANQGFFKNIWGGITGQNRKIRGEIDYNYAVSQYASQKMIKTLAKQNKLTFDAVLAVNTKLNSISIETETEFNNVYENMQAIGKHVDKNMQVIGEHVNQEITNVYKDMKKIFGSLLSEIVRDSARIGTLERSMNIVHLESTIKYLKYNDINYKDLPTEEKIFCVINDFLVACQNNYSMADILMLKPMLENIGVDIEAKANIADFYKKLIEKPEFIERIFDGLEKEKMLNMTGYITPFLAGIQKLENLNTSEKDTVSTISEMTGGDASDIKLTLLKKYIDREANLNIDNSNNECFDICVSFITEFNMIFNSTSPESSNNVSEGLALYEEEKYEEAIKCYGKAIELDPNDKEAYYFKGIVLGELCKYKEAVKCYDKAIELDPDDTNAYFNKGLALHNLEEYGEAIKCYDKAIERDHNHKEAYLNKGISLDELGKYKEAIKYYDKAIEIDPNFVIAYNCKGIALQWVVGRKREAKQWFDKARALGYKG